MYKFSNSAWKITLSYDGMLPILYWWRDSNVGSLIMVNRTTVERLICSQFKSKLKQVLIQIARITLKNYDLTTTRVSENPYRQNLYYENRNA